MDEKLLTEEQLAEALQVTTMTLSRWRSAGMPFLQFSRNSIRYRFDDCLSWARANAEQDTKAAV